MHGLEEYFETPGAKSHLARELGIEVQAISQWTVGRVPPLRVLDVERITGIHRHFLNPTIYPEPPQTRAARRAAEIRS
jgi:DNA-binding transcriptional regulator YdaS (Cro superfamily)